MTQTEAFGLFALINNLVFMPLMITAVGSWISAKRCRSPRIFSAGENGETDG